MKKLLSHPAALRTGRILKAVVITLAVILAVAAVTTITVDLGPAVRRLAEEQGSRYLQRDLKIGRLSIRLWNGAYEVEDIVIGGLDATSQPFFTAERITVRMPWSTLFDRRVVLETIEMTNWRMHVELRPDGTSNFPRITRGGPRGQSRWTTTLQYVRASGGEFTYQDHGTPWGIVARNLDVTVSRPANEYIGQASFSDGLVAIQSYVPFRADMTSNFKIDGGRVIFDRIDLTSEGAKTVVNGDVNLSFWPEQMFRVQSTIDFERMRELFFANETFRLGGTGRFDGVFHLFKEPLPDGRTRTGRELKGAFYSSVAGVNDYRFENLQGNVRWTPERLEVTEATANAYGGFAKFAWSMAPLGQRGVRATQTFDADYSNIDLTTFTNFLELDGIRLAGRMSGRNSMQWPTGLFAQAAWKGDVRIAPPAGAELMTRRMPLEQIAARGERGEPLGPFSPHTPREPVAIGGALTYAVSPEWVDIGPSRIATGSTYVEFEGRTAFGERSRIPFHVSSSDWQESDRVFAGLLTAFGSPTNAIPIGGYGTFDGVMRNAFRRPRIEGTFAGEQMRAFDVVWGSARGTAVIENNYADVKDVVVASGDSSIRADGRFSLGFPRRDRAEEINAIVRLERRPASDLRHAFGLDEYDLDGLISGEFHVLGHYTTPVGFGSMQIENGVAYGEPFERAGAGVRLEGDGVRLDNIQIQKGAGRGTGAAFVGWNGTYSFNFDAREIPLESVALTRGSPLPLSGLLDFSAGGSGTFDAPRYDVRGTLRDFFVADEGIGQVIGDINIAGDLMTLKIEAASPRLAVSGAGRIALTDEMDAELSFNVSDTSLDPYVRAFEPRLSPFTTAVASGTIRVVGELANLDHLLVDVSVDRLDLSLFDYALRNATPIRLALDRHSVRIAEMRLVGQDTQLEVSGVANLHDERIAVRATGDANLGILQGFVPNVRSSGRAALSATFEGPLRDPNVGGTMTLENGRIRHFSLPHALENISGAVRFDSQGLNLEGLTGRLGGGDVVFGGRIDKVGYLPGRLDITMVGTDMRLRFPEGMRSLVNADLALQGTLEAATLTGDVVVRDAVYTRPFDAGGGLLDFGGDVVSQTSSSLPTTTIPLRYDVRISAPSTLSVRNNLLDLVATADLQLRGTFDRPLLFGRLDVDRGDVRFEGKRYVVTRGSIDFNNPTRIEPFFDLEAETRVRVPGDTYRVTVRATGPMESLTFGVESDPPLAEVEVLALLFSDVAPGQDVEFRRYAEVTPQQQLLQERAQRALTGTISSEVGRVVEQTFGVDTFQITPSLIDPNQQSSRLEPAARVVIGKRLSERVYLTYSRSLSSSTRDQIILLEYDQSNRFSWILSRNEDRTYALDVRVRHTF